MDTKIKLLHEAVPLGLITVNEARHLLALPHVEDGGRRLQSLNYVSAEKADADQLDDITRVDTFEGYKEDLTLYCSRRARQN